MYIWLWLSSHTLCNNGWCSVYILITYIVSVLLTYLQYVDMVAVQFTYLQYRVSVQLTYLQYVDSCCSVHIFTICRYGFCSVHILTLCRYGCYSVYILTVCSKSFCSAHIVTICRYSCCSVHILTICRYGCCTVHVYLQYVDSIASQFKYFQDSIGSNKQNSAFEHAQNMQILLAKSEGPDQTADAQADLSLCCPHMPEDTFFAWLV